MDPVLTSLEEKAGFWSPITSTLDWCEENYVVSPYIAEYWNTLSNLIMIVPPLLGVYFSWVYGLERRYWGCFLGLTSVGIGSWMFHMTLRYSMQLMDEIPMLWGTTFLVYATHQFEAPKGVTNYNLIVFLALYASISSVIYLIYPHRLIHNIAYGLMVVYLSVEGGRVLIKKRCFKKLYLAALLSYVTGFIFWNIDNVFCAHLRETRKYLHGSLQPVTQFHAIWHLLAGIGTYLSILFMIHTRLLHLKLKPELRQAAFVLPYIHVKSAE